MVGNREFSFFISSAHIQLRGAEPVSGEENAKVSPFPTNVGGQDRGFHHIGGKADPRVMMIHI